MGRTRALLAVLAACLLSVLTAVPAAAAYQEQTGHLVTPGQPYGGKSRSGDWLGSYLVNGKQVFCVQFEYKAPDTDEQYQPGDELRTKWGDPLSPDVSADISYLLLRYGDTKNPDQAAALAHLLHSWTSPPRQGHDDLNPNNDFRHIAYDAPFHLAKLPAAAQQAVRALTADAEANRGPWTAEITAPRADQLIGTAGEWTVTVRNAKGKGMADVPVTLQLTGAALADGGKKAAVTTGDDGTATVKITPTAADPQVTATLSAPADKPYVQAPVDVDTQRVVSTGGEKELTAKAGAKASTKPGSVQVTKLDAQSGKGISGVALRLTAKDHTAPAKDQDGKPLTGPDGKPAVLTTEGDEGKVTVGNLRTPQEICVVEVSPPDGYDQAFDPANPPSACGTVQPGETLALAISNVPNQVPTAIPAGADPPTAVLHASTTVVTSPLGVATLGGLALFGAGLVGFLARRRFR
ncbi:hypothetical protein FHX82_001680 [Amycolatopsis bartoniae]|uniref:Prealbumin-like fold domain-containing protein n=1 Tax=Amycolatopsis bartoniae TaxID=941986 RepID=A0A8H9ITJ8_9PSEU|nr:hypothetical protein [Amycolatopsis bartoniae]MBB2934660.1 hypothetical protein [Amycolatopsis bartoniae]TVT09322.1 hypothetical protein FNH07_09150 [Amycolatopsis bartoniae]GHF45746.1 hypothetical protein GCM10017566_18490 [Amycolatopsis bartoniae]